LVPSTRISSSTIEASGCDEFEEVGLAFEEVGEEVGILDGQGAELVEERLRGLQLLAERPAWVAVHDTSRRHGASATHSEIAVARFVAGYWRFKVGGRKFTDGCAVRRFC
jgi:hypothetical protein